MGDSKYVGDEELPFAATASTLNFPVKTPDEIAVSSSMTLYILPASPFAERAIR
jgi:hypothetical protein